MSDEFMARHDSLVTVMETRRGVSGQVSGEAPLRFSACSSATSGSSQSRGKSWITLVPPVPTAFAELWKAGSLPVPACRCIDVTDTPQTSHGRPGFLLHGAMTVPGFATLEQMSVATAAVIVLGLRFPG